MLYRAVFYRSLPKVASRIGYDIFIFAALIYLAILLSRLYPQYIIVIALISAILGLIYSARSTLPLFLLLFRKKPIISLTEDGIQFDIPYYQRLGFSGFIEWGQIISTQLVKYSFIPPQQVLLIYIFDLAPYSYTASNQGPAVIQRPSKSFSIMIPDILTISLRDLRYIITSESNISL